MFAVTFEVASGALASIASRISNSMQSKSGKDELLEMPSEVDDVLDVLVLIELSELISNKFEHGSHCSRPHAACKPTPQSTPRILGKAIHE